MKLDARQLAVVENQTGAMPVPDGDPAMEFLQERFGIHTFFLDPNGLYIFEEVELPDAEEGALPALLIQIAEWVDEDRTSIGPIEPTPADLIIDLATEIETTE